MRQCDNNLQITVIIFRGVFSEGNPTPEKHKMDINYLYLGLASAGAVVVVLGIVGIICLLKKRNNIHRYCNCKIKLDSLYHQKTIIIFNGFTLSRRRKFRCIFMMFLKFNTRLWISIPCLNIQIYLTWAIINIGQ